MHEALRMKTMSQFDVELIPILDENYVFLLKNKGTQSSILVDPGEAGACLGQLQKQKLKLEAILVTHHHADHISFFIECKCRGVHKAARSPQCFSDELIFRKI